MKKNSSLTEDTLSSFEAEGENESAKDVSSDNTSSVSDESSADNSSEAENPYPNESMTNFGALKDDELDSILGKAF